MHPSMHWQVVCKRLMDIIVSAALLVAMSPLLVAAALAIKLTSPGSVLYRWPVVGKAGKPVRAYKFRTMVVGAETIKAQLWDQNEATGPVFKMRNDPRVTSVGRILRKFGLDELPQLWSVVKGDLSLVGPRPMLISEWEKCNEWQRRKLSTKPGIICLWHLRGQPRDFDEWVRLDLEYIEHWSLWLDLRILAGAVGFVVAGKNY
jgi:lipopolysaccharide/colanic/teichoic acid biosynthesis glycosyltransferase